MVKLKLAALNANPFIIVLFITLASGQVMAQDKVIPLIHEEKEVSFQFGGTTMYNDGSVLTAVIEQKKSTSDLRLDSLTLFSIDFITAGIDIHLSRIDSSDMKNDNSYYVALGFFNAKKEFVFGHNFCSDYGFSLAGVRTDLQATKMTLKKKGSHHSILSATAKLSIHQTFLYENEIKYVVLSIMHMGAG